MSKIRKGVFFFSGVKQAQFVRGEMGVNEILNFVPIQKFDDFFLPHDFEGNIRDEFFNLEPNFVKFGLFLLHVRLGCVQVDGEVLDIPVWIVDVVLVKNECPDKLLLKRLDSDRSLLVEGVVLEIDVAEVFLILKIDGNLDRVEVVVRHCPLYELALLIEVNYLAVIVLDNLCHHQN